MIADNVDVISERVQNRLRKDWGGPYQLDLFEEGAEWIYNNQTFPKKVEEADVAELQRMRDWEIGLVGFNHESGMQESEHLAAVRLRVIEERIRSEIN
jgi:hypothetical protein